MEQFNLDEYLKNPDRKIVTRDGCYAVRILCTDKKGKWPIVALVCKDEEEYVATYTRNGQKYIPKAEVSLNDLFFVSEKREGWINIYTNNYGVTYSGQKIYDIYENAETAGRSLEGYLTTAKIEWEE